MRRSRFTAHFILVLSILIAPPLIAQTSYTFTDLGIDGYGNAVNSTGQVAGVLGGAAVSGPEGTNFHSLNIPNGVAATGVNDAGQVAGYANGPDQAFLSAPNGFVTYLGTLAGGTFTQSWGINSTGQVTGYGDVSGGATHAFVSAPNGGALTDLGTFVGSASWGYTVNDLGQVAGYSQSTDPMGLNTSYRAFLSGVSNDLGTLGSGGSSWGYGVNDLGQVTGMSDLLPGAPFSFPRHAFLSAPGGGPLTDLGALGAGSYSDGIAVNNSGTVVGQTLGTDGAFHAFVYTAAGGMRDLNDLIPTGTGFVLDAADGINGLGQITGAAIDSMGRSHAFLLTPIEAVPEPATWLVGALALLAIVRKRQLRKT